MEQSTTTESLRGIHAADPGVAWASGTNGIVLRTEDAGFVWQGCAMPPGAEKLDFRSVWAWDAMTAIVMSSGPGDKSRLYRTTDGCVSWKLLATNSDQDGFWDGIAFLDRDHGYLLGDPVGDEIVLMRTADGGTHWQRINSPGLSVAGNKLGFFAASNSSLLLTAPTFGDSVWLGTGSSRSTAAAGPFLLRSRVPCTKDLHGPDMDEAKNCITARWTFDRQRVPLAAGTEAAGIFSIGLRVSTSGATHTAHAIAVGGDYQKPGETSGTAAWSSDFGEHWKVAAEPPHGYRSAVAWSADFHAWVTAGPDGTDYSRNDGRTWQSLESGSWNAISLPWLVGPHGRIGKLVSLTEAGNSAAGQDTHSIRTGAKTR